ncbi:MAG: methyltransferase domain-containing protein [Methylococcaceae bacterium]|nr:methyltransferase domain-containing protein [Methylococcaceae bacterium]
MTNLRLCYQTVEFGKIDIHLCTLRNKQEFYDPAGIAEKLGICSASWPIFGVIWPSSLVLAHFIFDYDIGSKRILEVGCGMALSSLLLNQQCANITATDYHPEAHKFLQRNVLLNGGRSIAFEQVDWADMNDNLGSFDLIIGSDLLYEDNHIELLANFINRHSNPACEIIIVDPGRGKRNKLSYRMMEFGFTFSYQKPSHTDYIDQEFKGHIIKYVR